MSYFVTEKTGGTNFFSLPFLFEETLFRFVNIIIGKINVSAVLSFTLSLIKCIICLLDNRLNITAIVNRQRTTDRTGNKTLAKGVFLVLETNL